MQLYYPSMKCHTQRKNAGWFVFLINTKPCLLFKLSICVIWHLEPTQKTGWHIGVISQAKAENKPQGGDIP